MTEYLEDPVSAQERAEKMIAALEKEAGHNEVEWDIERSGLRDTADLIRDLLAQVATLTRELEQANEVVRVALRDYANADWRRIQTETRLSSLLQAIQDLEQRWGPLLRTLSATNGLTDELQQLREAHSS